MTPDRHIPSHPNADAPTLPPADPKAGGAGDAHAPTLPPTPTGATLAETIGATDALIAPSVAGGRCFGEYELIEEIARGGMGVVYKARQSKLNRTVALKMILAGQLAGEDDVKRFYTEAESAAGLDHPGIVPIYEVGQCDGQHFFSMAYIEGQSLAARVAAGPVPPREAADLVRQVAEAVQFAHDKGVIHRDLKPANILLQKTDVRRPSGSSASSFILHPSSLTSHLSAFVPKITDFGLAKRVAVESGLTNTGQVLGTPSFMPPEQAGGKLDQIGPLSDVYALGAILYTLLTGRPPFQAASVMDTLLQVIEREPLAPRQLIADVPRDLETIALKCLQKEPARRYASAQAVADDLGRFLADEPIAARPTSAAYKLWRKAKRNRAVSLAAVAIVVLTLVGLGLAGHARRKAGEAAVASTSAKGIKQALERVQRETLIQQLAVLPFRNLAGKAEAEWIGAAFAAELESQLSGHAGLRVVGKGPIEEAAASLRLPIGAALDESQARRLGERLVVDHVVVGHFQQLGGQLQVSIKIVNLRTGAIDRGGMQVRGKFPEAVFDLQARLALQCLSQLGVKAPASPEAPDAPVPQQSVQTASNTASPPSALPRAVAAAPAAGPEAPAQPEAPDQPDTQAADQPAASVEAWVLLGQGQHALAQRDYDEAIRLLSQAIEQDPQSWKAHRALGQAYHKAARADDAAAAFRKALAINPDDLVSRVYFNLVSGRISEGFDALEQASKAGLADLDMLKLSITFRFSSMALTGGAVDEKLLAELSAAVKKYPKDDELWVLLSMAQAANGKEDAAIESLREAASANPASYVPHFWLAISYEKLKRPDEAERERQEAKRLKPAGARGCREFGALYFQTGQLDKALREFDEARRLEPGAGSIDLVLGQFYAVRDARKAVEYFEAALAKEPNSALVLGGLCRMTNLMQDNERLTRYALRWTEADSDSYEAHQYLRMAYLKTGRQAEAEAQRQRLSGLTPTHAAFFFWTGNSLLQGLQFDEAIAVLGRGHAEFPDNLQIAGLLHLGQGWKLVVEEHWDEAIEPLKQSQVELPGVPDATLHLTTCFQNLGRWSEAADQAQKLLAGSPQSLPYFAGILKRARRFDEAIKFGQQALAAAPRNVELRKLHLDFYLLAGRVDEALAEARLATPQAWLVAGPLAPGATVPSAIDPDAPLDGRTGPVRWRASGVQPGDYVNLIGLYPGASNVCAVAVSYVDSAAERQSTLKVGSDDGITIWLNDELVREHRVARQFKPGEDSVTVTLRKGQNKLVLRIDQGIGDWGFSLEPFDEQGMPVAVEWSTDPDRQLGEARLLGQTLLDRMLLKTEVARLLRGDAGLDAALRERALALVERLEENAERLVTAVREVVLDPGRGDDEYALALAQAEAAWRLAPSDAQYLATLGAAQYRAGRDAEAVATLQASEQTVIDRFGAPKPQQLAFLAMAMHRLHRDDEARRYLGRLRDLSYSDDWAAQPSAPALLREAEAAVAPGEEDGEVAAILRTVYGAEQAGWLRHDVEAFLGLWTDDVTITGGRGPEPDGFDRTIDRRTMEATQRLVFQGPPPQGLALSYETVAVKIDGDEARHDYNSVVRFEGGYESYAATSRLRRTQQGWQVFKNRSWPVKKRHGDRVLVYDDAGLKELDAVVDERCAEGDRRGLIESLANAHHLDEAHAEARLLTASPAPTAGDWALRGSMALRASDADDAIASFKRALELDGNAHVPPLRELIVAAPPTLRLAEADLPPEREAETRSGAADMPAALTVVNETRYTLELFWLDDRGRRVSYGWIHPRATHEQSTFAKHFFLVADTAGRALGIIQPHPPSRTIALRAMD